MRLTMSSKKSKGKSMLRVSWKSPDTNEFNCQSADEFGGNYRIDDSTNGEEQHHNDFEASRVCTTSNDHGFISRSKLFIIMESSSKLSSIL